MQNRQSLLGWWEHFRQQNGITFRLVSAIPADQFDRTVVPNMRTPRQQLLHMYGQIVRDIPIGIAKGEIADFDQTAAEATYKTKDDVLRFCRECWAAADGAAKTITDANLQAMVKTPWGGMSMPGFVCASIISDEYLHHRGQLYAYSRVLGLEPPKLWDFEHNETAFAPKQEVTA